MKVTSLAAIALTILIAPQALPGQAPDGSSQAQPTAQRTRSPREDDELRADIMMARKQYPEAAVIYQKLLRQEPRNALLLNKLGIAYHQQGMLDQAKRYYERAVKADRTFANAVNNKIGRASCRERV